MSYPVVRENTEFDEILKALKNHQERLRSLEYNIWKLMSPEVVHVQVTSFAAATIPVDIYYVKTSTMMSMSIMPFSFTSIAKHGLYVTIPDIQLPDNGVLRKFLYILTSGSTHSECELAVDTSGGGCQLQFFRDINANPLNASTSYSMDYILSISFLIV